MYSKKQLFTCMILMLILMVCLCITSFAIGYTTYEVKNNTFKTGGIEIDLNGGRPIITEDEFLFEPGMTVDKPFYIRNNSTWAVYYKLYFEGVDGDLSDVIDVYIMDGDEILMSGKLSSLTASEAGVFEDELEVGQRRDYTMRFHFPEQSGNSAQNGTLEFRLSAIAVQTKNNPDKAFD